MSQGPALPPGGKHFSLDRRPAAGLYLVAWLLSGIGVAVLLIAFQTRPPVTGILLVGGMALLLVGLSAAAGYQLVGRRRREGLAFHGPSPPILLGIQLIAVYTPLLFLQAAGMQTASGPGFLVASAFLLAGYAGVLWLFAVRSGALRWREMGLPVGSGPRRLAADIGHGAVTMLLVWFVATLAAALVATLIGTRSPSVLPSMGGPLDLVLVLIGAALLVPIGEELFFRGYALTAWWRDLGPRAALVRSTMFFALVHVATVTSTSFDQGARQALLVVLIIAPVGLALGWLFMRRGLLAAIAGHVTFNVIGVVLIALAQTLPPLPIPG